MLNESAAPVLRNVTVETTLKLRTVALSKVTMEILGVMLTVQN